MPALKPRLSNGWLETPHAVFVRDAAMSDETLFAALGMAGQVRPMERKDTSDGDGLIYVARGVEWVHVMDGWRTPMRRHHVRGSVAALARERGAEVFWFDQTRPGIAFEYYAGGALVRHYEEVWTQLEGLEERIDVGEALAGELDAEGCAMGVKHPRAIARSLGITDAHRWETLRVYACSGSI